MRPHKLVMKAFGPFAKETVVDFDAMGNNVYLISGDTGAGKTTIFDAIVYALYGKASGNGRSSLGTEAFHSDYAKHGKNREEMRVELTFSEAGRTFTVLRRMYWGVKGDSQSSSKEAVLTENGTTLASSTKKESSADNDVTTKITEIVGLDADQFRRIIMLAQGEFRRFLEAKSDDRGDILGKLFDNRRHEDLQFRLAAANSALKEKTDDLALQEKARIDLLVIPEDLDEQERACLSADHPRLTETVRMIIEGQKKALREIGSELQEKEKRQNSLTEQKAVAEKNNGLLSQRKDAERTLQEEERKKEAVDTLRRRVSLAEAAEKVLPYDQARKKAKTDWESALQKIAELEEGGKCLEQRKQTLEADKTETDERCDAQIDQRSSRISDLHAILDYYDELDKSLRQYRDAKARAEEAAAAAEASAKDLKKKEDRMQELRLLMTSLQDAGEAAVQNAERAVQDLTDRRNSLTEIQIGVQDILKQITEEENLKQALFAAQKAAADAEAEHLRLNREFLDGQAGVLAQELARRLETEDSAPCPVCGVMHTKADTGCFASAHGEVPERSAVDAAQRERNRKEEAARKAELDFNDKQTARSHATGTLLLEAEKLLGAADWEQLSEGTRLNEELNRCSEKLEKAKQNLQTARRDSARKTETQNEIAKLDKDIEQAAEKEKQDAASAQTSRQDVLNASEIADSRKKKLEGWPATKQAAEAEIRANRTEIDALKEQMKRADEVLKNALSALSENSGKLVQAQKELQEREQAQKEAERVFDETLRRQNFESTEAYTEACSPEGMLLSAVQLERWAASGRKSVDAYDEKVRDLKTAISQLEKNTEGLTWTDVAMLEEQIVSAGQEVTALREAENGLQTGLRTNRSALSELERIAGEKKRVQLATKKLQPLAEAANSKYSFSRYVLSDFFDRIIEQANVHLDTMTDGEYRLIPTEEGDKRSSLGLGLKVLNTITNLERETASLSGGQSFEASLSLALGLSDIVQMQSGSSIQIDSMFIDEGFGSLDGTRLDRAMDVLQHLSSGKRQIGIISHVARLDECLQKKIHVIAEKTGSRVTVETDE